MKFLLFGTGDYYERYRKWFDPKEVISLLDNAPDKQNTCIDGIKILSPEQGIRLDYDAVVILSFYVKAMKRQLVELGVPEDKIYHFYDLHDLICCRCDGQKADYKKTVRYYCGAEKMEKSRAVLLLSHDLTMGGPALALYHMAQTLRKQGREVVMASMLDGPLREVLTAEGIPTVVDVNLQVETMQEAGWIQGFYLIVCNTINFHVFLSERNADIPVIWWLHDSSFFYDGVNPKRLRSMPRKNMKVCAVSPVAREAATRFCKDMQVEDLIYGVADEAGGVRAKNESNGKTCFVTIGYIEERKGQDILAEAICGLPKEIRRKSVFYMVGQDSSRMAGQIREGTADIPEVCMTGVLGREAIHEILEKADVLVCPSREDPMPTVAAEAMMHGVPCILSDATGTAKYIRDGMDGIVFKSEDVEQLAERIVWCIENPQKIADMRIPARKVYEKVFSMEAFEESILRIMPPMQGQEAR
ncbi:MAG: glycosyltransferase family 4 protein [Lachnospiraceae bacterium]|nr:glycosyltransferase family 4 protein [Lachnospiraceae bacterium]